MTSLLKQRSSRHCALMDAVLGYSQEQVSLENSVRGMIADHAKRMGGLLGHFRVVRCPTLNTYINAVVLSGTPQKKQVIDSPTGNNPKCSKHTTSFFSWTCPIMPSHSPNSPLPAPFPASHCPVPLSSPTQPPSRTPPTAARPQ